MSNKKLKVVWLCYFTNTEIQKILKPLRTVNEIAPWITNLIPLFENNENVELHIISQHEWIPFEKSFTINGVTYHFFNFGIPLLGRHWPGFFRFDFITDYFFLKYKVRKIIQRINPDIIHLHGAENEFCTAITQFHRKYPVFITIQGFISKSSADSKIVQSRKKKEFEILKMFTHFGIRTETMGFEVKAINPNAQLHWHDYRMKPVQPYKIEKEYDLVFFARISKDKGIVDLLKVVALIKKDKPDTSLCVIGGGKIDEFKLLATKLGIEKNVHWAGFLPAQEDVHRLASKSKISVLPTYHDIVSGTIIESLFLKIPVVAYDVGSIHEVNKFDEIISLVPKGDIQLMARAILKLLSNERIQKEKAEKGYKRATEVFCVDDKQIRNQLLTAYGVVITDFQKKQKQHIL